MADGEKFKKNMQEGAKATKDASKASETLKENIKDVLFFSRDYADEAKKLAKEVMGGSIAASETAKAFRDVASAAKDITDNYADVLTGEKKFQDLVKEREKLNKAQKGFNTEFEQFLGTLALNQDEINSIIRDGASAFEVVASSGADLTNTQYDLLDLFEEQNAQLSDEADNMKEIAKRAETIDAAMRPLGKSALALSDIGEGLTQGLSKAGLGGVADKLGLGDAVDDARQYAAELTKGGEMPLKFGGKMKVAGKAVGGMVKNLMKGLGPIGLIALAVDQIVQAFQLVDGQSKEIAQNLGVSVKEGRAQVVAAKEAADASGDLLVSTKDVVSAQMSLNSLLGTAVQFSGEFAAEFASISERTGLSEKAMAKFATKAMIADGTIKSQLVKVAEVTQEMNAQNGISLSMKDIQEGIATISNANALSAKNNTKELTRQVFQAKLLGLEQGKINDIADSLLDFESSIQKEMEAELLIGKQLNLEKAREAALMNDMTAVAAELAKQGITASEFGNMNRIQQEATAAAMGMSRDEMGDMLMNQEKIASLQKKFGKDIKSVSEVQAKYNKMLKEGTLTEQMKKDLAEEGILQQMESANAQDKLNAAMEKMQDLFVGIVTPLMPLIDSIMKLLDPVFKILQPIFKLIGILNDLILTTLEPLIDSILAMFEGLEQTITSAINLDFSGMLDGLKSVGKGIIDFVLSPFDGVIKLINRIPGVDLLGGKTITEAVGLADGGIVTKPTMAMIGEGGESEAVIPLSKLNQVTGNSRKNDMAETNRLLKTLIEAVNSGGDVYMDGNKVGKSLALATSNMG
tara:strand:+ start:9865 stop:12279 length:2415 start_codon:yes stop_codon:yes gene_type:complete